MLMLKIFKFSNGNELTPHHAKKHFCNEKMRVSSSPVLAFVAGVAALLLGVAYYIEFRQPESALFLNIFNVANRPHYADFIPFFPSFIHVFGFALMTSAFVWKNDSHIRNVCISWGFINVAFECVQLFSPNFGWGGAFDLYDILAAFVGSVCAFIVISCLLKRS
ncbi:MAG: hypothetical protein ACR2P5_09915 [Gammaproteobacteria bacterium]